MRWIPYVAVALGSAFLVAGVGSQPSAADGVPAYQAAKSCKKCHFSQFKSWKKTTMALAFESLKPGVRSEAKVKAGLDPEKDYTTDPKCLSCHTTGYGKPGGFVSMEKTPDLAGIACDACHGPSESYFKIMTNDNKAHAIKDMTDRGLIYPPTEAVCTQCHGDDSPFNASVDPKYAFNFEERVRNEEGTHKHKALKADHPDLASLKTVFQ